MAHHLLGIHEIHVDKAQPVQYKCLLILLFIVMLHTNTLDSFATCGQGQSRVNGKTRGEECRRKDVSGNSNPGGERYYGTDALRGYGSAGVRQKRRQRSLREGQKP